MVFNGEVYNYVELRQELQQHGYRFETTSDTEAILKSYHFWGADAVNHFVGMWALAIWDDRAQRLFCSRDRFGIKPFVFRRDEQGGLWFASEIKALKQSPGFQKTLNVDQATQTYSRGVEALAPAHNLIVDASGTRFQRYWSLDPLAKRSGDPRELQREFAERFNQSLEIHLRSQVEVGACLSGGIDSSAIVSSMCRLRPQQPQKVFHIYYADFVDERPFAQQVLDAYPQAEAHYYSPSGPATSSPTSPGPAPPPTRR